MGEHILLRICVFQVGELILLGVRVSQVGEHMSLGICVSKVGEQMLVEICISQVAGGKNLNVAGDSPGCQRILTRLVMVCFFYMRNKLNH